jgi:hypothetical protein
VNFSPLKVANATTPINQSSIVDAGKTNGLMPIVTYNGVEILECLCGEGI